MTSEVLEKPSRITIKFCYELEDGAIEIKDDVLDDNPRSIVISKERYQTLKKIQRWTMFVEIFEPD